MKKISASVFLLFLFKISVFVHENFLDTSKTEKIADKKWRSIVFVVGPNSFNGNQNSVKVIREVKKSDDVKQ